MVMMMVHSIYHKVLLLLSMVTLTVLAVITTLCSLMRHHQNSSQRRNIAALVNFPVEARIDFTSRLSSQSSFVVSQLQPGCSNVHSATAKQDERLRHVSKVNTASTLDVSRV
jgi:CHASE3 domain sensor protein